MLALSSPVQSSPVRGVGFAGEQDEVRRGITYQGVPIPSCDCTELKNAKIPSTLLEETSTMKSQKLSCAAGQRYLRRTRRTSVRSETVLAIPVTYSCLSVLYPLPFLVLSYIISVVV